jgi:hypothetical protein
MTSIAARLGLALAVAIGGCGGSQRGLPPMTNAPSTELHASADLIGFWQFSAGDGPHFGVIDRDAERTRTTLTIGQVQDRRPRIVKSIGSPDLSIRGVDARVAGAELVFVLEINVGRALQLARADLSALLDPARKEVTFSGMRDLNLSTTQAARVVLPPANQWNVADTLGPEEWLFSPRFLRGADAPPAVAANTADGQAMLFGDAPGAETFVVAAAAEPQVLVHNGQQIVAARRFPKPYQPFWSLRRYSGGTRFRTAELTTIEDGATLNVSNDLKIGPVVAFALVAGEGGAPWLFALRDSGAVSDVVAITRNDRGWAAAGTLPLDARGEQLSVEYAADGWRLLFATRTGERSTLRYQTWTIPR